MMPMTIPANTQPIGMPQGIRLSQGSGCGFQALQLSRSENFRRNDRPTIERIQRRLFVTASHARGQDKPCELEDDPDQASLPRPRFTKGSVRIEESNGRPEIFVERRCVHERMNQANEAHLLIRHRVSDRGTAALCVPADHAFVGQPDRSQLLDATIEAQAGLADLHDFGAALCIEDFRTRPQEASERLAVGAIAAYAGTGLAGDDVALYLAASAFQSMHLLDLPDVGMMGVRAV
jgi:hypothetical protein